MHGQNRGKGKNETRARRNRAWREIEKIVGPGLFDLPAFFKNGLYRLHRGGLTDAEIVRAFERCHAWVARTMENGLGECECGCGTKHPVGAVNGQGQSVWCLDHDPSKKAFRGILHQRCNMELGDGNRQRKWAHVNFIEAHETRLPEEAALVRDRDEFQATGAVD